MCYRRSGNLRTHSRQAAFGHPRPRRSTCSWWRHRRSAHLDRLIRTFIGAQPRATIPASSHTPLKSREQRQDERWHRHVIGKVVSQGIWTQQRVAKRLNLEVAVCQLYNEARGTVCHRCYEWPVLQADSEAAKLAGGPWAWELFERATHVRPRSRKAFAPTRVPSFMVQPASKRHPRRNTRHRQVFFWTRGASPSWLDAGGDNRRGWWWWACCTLCETARTMRRQRTTFDPVTLHIDCAATVESIRAPRQKTLSSASQRTHIWSSFSSGQSEGARNEDTRARGQGVGIGGQGEGNLCCHGREKWRLIPGTL